MTPQSLAAMHKRHVENPSAGIPVHCRGSELNFRLLIVEGFDRDTVCALTGLTRSELVSSVQRHAAEPYGTKRNATITEIRRAYKSSKMAAVHTALRRAA